MGKSSATGNDRDTHDVLRLGALQNEYIRMATPDTPPGDIPIAIVGGGMAGLSCAQRLKEHGLNPLVIDRGRNAGGRMTSRQITHLGREVWFDQGASKLDARSDRLRTYAERLVSQGVATWRTKNEIFGEPSMRAIVSSLSEGQDVLCSAEVRSIRRDVDRFILTVQRYGEESPVTISADHVVIASPAEQSIRILEQSGLTAPAALRSVRSSTAWMIMFALSGIDLEEEWIRLDGNEQDLLQEVRLRRVAPSTFSIVGEMKSQLATSLRDQDPQVIMDRMMESCKSMLEQFLHTQITPDQSSDPHVHRWGFARPLMQIRAPYLIENETDIAFVGDWLSGPQGEWRDAEAAFLSGISVADYLAELR